MFPRITFVTHQPSSSLKARQRDRIVGIIILMTAICYFGYYDARFYYVSHIQKPAYMSMLQEIKGDYCCSCKKIGSDSTYGYTARKKLRIKPGVFLLPAIETSPSPFYFSFSWQPPDGSFERVESRPPLTDILYDLPAEQGRIYVTADQQIQLISDKINTTVIPIRWGEKRFLVEKDRIDDFCRGPVIAAQCYYASEGNIHDKPVYLDGTLACPLKK